MTLGDENTDIEANSINTEQADITGETFIRATRGTDTSSTSSGTWVNAFDGESKDNRDEFNSSGQFVPEESGEYDITVYYDYRGSTGAGDLLQGRIQDIDSGIRAGPILYSQSTGPIHVSEHSWSVDLTAGTTYEFQGRNNSSSFEITANETVGIVKREVVHD